MLPALFPMIAIVAALLCLLFARYRLRLRSRRLRRLRRRTRLHTAPTDAAATGFPVRKPDWVRRAVLDAYEHTGQSHRKLAKGFNRLYFARTGISVGRTWVRDLIKQQAYHALHAQHRFKHRVPQALPNNAEWGLDTTVLRDARSKTHLVLGLIDHGSRLNLMLQALPRFNTWTLLGSVFLAIGRHGKPAAIRLDNHPVHRAKRVKTVMRWMGIRLRFSQPASPWQNGRIERFFGTLKSHLQGLRFLDETHLLRGLKEFRHYYNHVRGHQHLGGRTPADVWHGIDPYRQAPRRCLWFEGWDGRLRGWRLLH